MGHFFLKIKGIVLNESLYMAKNPHQNFEYTLTKKDELCDV